MARPKGEGVMAGGLKHPSVLIFWFFCIKTKELGPAGQEAMKKSNGEMMFPWTSKENKGILNTSNDHGLLNVPSMPHTRWLHLRIANNTASKTPLKPLR